MLWPMTNVFRTKKKKYPLGGKVWAPQSCHAITWGFLG